MNTEFDDLSSQVLGKAIEVRSAPSFFHPLVSCLPFVVFVVKKSILTIHHEEHEGVNTEFDDLSSQVLGKAIEVRSAPSFFHPLVSCLPFVVFVSFVVKSDCFLCFSFFMFSLFLLPLIYQMIFQ